MDVRKLSRDMRINSKRYPHVEYEERVSAKELMDAFKLVKKEMRARKKSGSTNGCYLCFIIDDLGFPEDLTLDLLGYMALHSPKKWADGDAMYAWEGMHETTLRNKWLNETIKKLKDESESMDK